MAQNLHADPDESASSPEAASGSFQSGPFRDGAPEALRAGLAVVPCGGGDGKVPLVNGWGGWTRPPGRAFLEKMVRQHPSANVGIVTGRPSGVTVVDCDDPAAAAVMLERCGPTPLKVRTPSGGVHLWYRFAGEASADLRSEGLNVDVKGAGGIAVVPPSMRPNGPHAGRAYEFLKGSWQDLDRLPALRPGSLSVVEGGAGRPAPLRAVREGRRNKFLFSHLLGHARHCDTVDALRDVAEAINSEQFDPPLRPAEVKRAVDSAWGYEERGQNWAGREAKALVTTSEFGTLLAHEHGQDAVILLLRFRFAHWERSEFTVSPKGMAEADVIPGWGPRRYRHALEALIENGLLTVTHRGGSRIGDARRFAFAASTRTPHLGKGAGAAPNIIEHRPPPLRARLPGARGFKGARVRTLCAGPRGGGSGGRSFFHDLAPPCRRARPARPGRVARRTARASPRR